MPDEGPALIVCNHVSYMDALILAASIPRPVRFVMYYKIFNIPVMRWIFRTAKAIPIAGARENPELMQRAFDEIDAALAEGEIVGIFPEGALTRDGEIAPFKSGVERILARTQSGRCRWCRWRCAACGPACGATATRAWAACACRGGSARMSKWWRARRSTATVRPPKCWKRGCANCGRRRVAWSDDSCLTSRALTSRVLIAAFGYAGGGET